MDYAMQVARMIHFDLTLLDAVAWYFWTAVSPEDWKDGLLYISKYQPFEPLKVPKVFWAFGNYSRYIRPGYRRVKVSGSQNPFGLMVLAFLGNRRKRLIIVAINHPKYQEEKLISVSRNLSIDLDVGTSRIESVQAYVTSPSLSLDKELVDLAGNTIDYKMPAESVVTFVAELRY